MQIIQSLLGEYYNAIIDISWTMIFSVIVFVLIFLKFGHILIEKLVRSSIKRRGESKKEEIDRENTIIDVLKFALNIFFVIVAILIILSELGVNIGPLLAGAGVAGIAIGFGAQYLIKDLINGTFILLENQYSKGDVICVNDTCGLVEAIDLRITTLRDLDGVVHYVPNGEIKIASNLTQSKSGVNLNVGVAYNSDLDKVERVINEVGEDIAKDKDWKEKIIEAPKVLRIDNLGDSSIEFKITGATVPMEQWAVTGELRKRIKKAFDKNGIEIPFPQRDVHTK